VPVPTWQRGARPAYPGGCNRGASFDQPESPLERPARRVGIRADLKAGDDAIQILNAPLRPFELPPVDLVDANTSREQRATSLASASPCSRPS
jgi:hypothetical protein